MNKKLGWLPNPKRKTGIFYNNVLENLYPSYWPYCGNVVSAFKKEFIIERNRQYQYTSVLENAQANLEYMRSGNEACAGKFVNKDYIPIPHDSDNLERLISNVAKMKEKMDNEREKLQGEDEALFCRNGKLKSGRQSHHKFNESTSHQMEVVSSEIEELRRELIQIKVKCKERWDKGGRRRSDKQRKRENNWKLKGRAQNRRDRRCRELYQQLGGQLVSEYFTPDMGAFQITDIDEEVLSNINLFDKQCLTHMLEEGCFRESALEEIELFL